MKRTSLAVVLSAFLFFSFFSSCKKINEATELGSELIPHVDNVHTFDTILQVETFNYLFASLEDTTTSTAFHYLGSINNDPLFGGTDASMYFQLRPNDIKRPFPFAKDSLVGLDSVVLVLGHSQVWGDSTLPQQVQVFEIPTNQSFSYTEDYRINKNNITNLGPALSSIKNFLPSTLNDSVFPRGEKAINQLRIPLDQSFGMRLLNYDTLNAYASDSAFKTYFNGFAVTPQNNGSANALMSFNLASANTKLAFYVRYKNAGRVDTSVVNFELSGTSAVANFIDRDYTGSEIMNAVNGSTPDDLLYIQSSPGSYATLKIPFLSKLNNRIVHLAELLIEQVPDASSAKFTPPTFLYLDAYDSSRKRYRTIPFDVLLAPVNGNAKGDTIAYEIGNAGQFGMPGIRGTDLSGNSIFKWRFNLTRYIQRVVNGTEPAQDLRLYSPFPTLRSLAAGVEQFISSRQSHAIGRVRLAGGNHPTQPMKLRIVYSKL
ncbi:MAG TPA: DUF4270 family protein [Chitinophagaceae bacterium]|nr:DUF4270 family protein [Chitinophagaceae bacterium]